MPISIHTRHLPPSVNACYSNVRGKGRVRTERYRQWANAAGWDCNGKGAIAGAFTITIVIDRDLRHARADIDNRIKPLLDLLQTHGIIENDNLCEAVTASWGDADGGVIVKVEGYTGNAQVAA